LAQQHAIMVIKTKSAVYLIYISLFHYKTHFMKDLQHQLHFFFKMCWKNNPVKFSYQLSGVCYLEVTMRNKGVLFLCIHSHKIFMFKKNKKTICVV